MEIELQGHFTKEEWQTLTIGELMSLHLIRECPEPEYQTPDEIFELFIRVMENKN